MRMWKRSTVVAALAVCVPGWAVAQSEPSRQEATQSQSQPSTLNQVLDRVAQREQQEVKTLRQYSPLVETYIQDMRPDKEMGFVPERDHYYLGVADLSKGVLEHSMVDKKNKGFKSKLNIFSALTNKFSSGYIPEGFVEMMFVDPQGFTRQNYHFDYVRREFLGEVRCLVFDVMPLPHSGKGRFKGRIWVEDQDDTIVRFNGVYVPAQTMFSMNLHFDSWRVNSAPGLWLPAYVYSEEADARDVWFGHVRFKSQTRFWGYNMKGAGREEEFSDLKVDSPNVKDQAEAAQDRSPLEAQREWQHQGELNVIDRLQRASLVAPVGEVDKVLDTVVNNLEVTNNVDVQPEIKCRVLLTSTLEAFTVGHTIVLSRGLLDVLPDEASLAAVLAHEMGRILTGQPLDDKWAFNDATMVTTVDTFHHFSFHADPRTDDQAGTRAVQLLKQSPYKDKLSGAGLFLRQLDAEQKQLPALISPHLGNRVAVASELEKSAPELQPAKLDQIAALPLGARIKLNPWNNQIELVKSKPVALLSKREKMPFEVTPFMPYLTRYAPSAATPAAADPPTKEDVAKQEPQH